MNLFSAKQCYRCYADCWDHAWVKPGRRGKDTEVIRCAFCGVLETRPMKADARIIEPAHDPRNGAFVFDSGRFQGKTLAEVIAHPSGRQYLDWARVNVDRWSTTIGEFLNNAAPSA